MKYDPVIAEAKRLYNLGYCIHWIHPKSKAPIGNGWAARERQSWAMLEKSYERGMNVGVKLGHQSRINGGSLVVIDFDLKSGEPKHKAEMLAALEKSFPGLHQKAPLVHSGRANGSGHLHVITMGPPQSVKYAQSSDVVKVHMPSAQRVSKREREQLTESEIKAGMRLRAAWEIGVMGEGTQVVLPPSLHPDSGKRYVWARNIEGAADLPAIEQDGKPQRESKGGKVATRINVPFEPIEVSLRRFELPDDVQLMLKECEDFAGNTDASALAFKATIALVKAGASNQEIASILTDRGEFALAEIGYRHRNTDDPEKAWAWVVDYCLAKARAEFGMAEQFDANCQVTPEEQARIDADSKTATEMAWTDGIDRNKQTNKPLITGKNIRLILASVVGPNVFRYNGFSNRVVYGLTHPWNEKKPDAEIADIDALNIQAWLAKEWGLEPTKAKIIEAIEQMASENSFHPVREYILGLEWDGIPRIDAWLKKYVGAVAREPYLSAISRKVLCAMVARVFAPGIKFDHVLVLEGAQGIGKSTVADILGGEWFTDAKLDLRDKDSMQTIFGRWVVELGELATIRHADLETTKAFISRRVDRLRISYGHYAQDFPRQTIFIGTTNADEYLKDPTGERRFWPVRCTKTLFDFESLRAVRDQLFAEAYFAWRDCGESLYLGDKERAASHLEQAERSEHDIWVDVISDFFKKEGFVEEGRDWKLFRLSDLFSDFGPLPLKSPGYPEQKRAATVLRALGYERIIKKVDGLTTKMWKLPITGVTASPGVTENV